MRARIFLPALAVVVTLLAPISQSALAFAGYASAPLDVTATPIAGGIRVGWSVPTDVDSGVTGYRVEYSTSGTTGTWILAASTGGATRSYDILGLSQSATYVRVAATTSAGVGTYGYPWTKIYGTTSLQRDANGYVVYENGFGLGGSDPFTTKSNAAFSRVRYRIDATISSVAYYAEADAYKWPNGTNTDSRGGWNPSVSSLMIPSNNSPYTYFVQANVADLNVYSNNSNVSKGKGLSGRLEIWPRNYGTAANGLSPAGDGATYDYDDTWNSDGSYGSFQVHDMTNLKPVFVWNDSAYGVTAEVGFGRNTGTHPDWTFCSDGGIRGSCPAPSYFRIQIFINEPVTPLPDSTPPVVSRIDTKIYAKNGDTLTVRSSEVGTVYLVKNSISVTSFSSISGAPSNQKNSVSISTAGADTVLTTSGLQDGIYNLYAVDSMNNVSTALANTITMDSTAPTISNIAVSSSGSTITLTASETMTKTGVGENLYTISDGGTSVAVESTGGTANQLQISINRAIPAGAVVTFAYNPANGLSGRWTDLAGNQLAAISSQTITNNSTTGVSISLTVPALIYKGVIASISTTVNYAGKVTFLNKGKRIAGCVSKRASGTPPITITCNFKAAFRGSTDLSAIFTPSNQSMAVVTAPIVNRFIFTKTSRR